MTKREIGCIIDAEPMKYYYLNSAKELQGPYSKEEMLSFLQSGLINDSTLAAVAGDSSWKPFSELLDKVGNDCSTWNNAIGNCPHCHIELTSQQVPENCPDCGRGIHGHTKGLWWAFIYALKNSFNWKGRATRTEFWGFYLFYYVFYQVVNIAGNVLMPSEINEKLMSAQESGDLSVLGEAFSSYFQNGTVAVIVGAQIVFVLALVFPFLSVSVRRLHDTGRSAFSVIFGVVSYLAFVGSTVWFIYVAALSGEEIISTEGVISSNIAFALLSLLANMLIFGAVSIYLLVATLLPSQKGANKYGPSTIYPKG